MATHSSILTWRIPWTVLSMGLQSRTQLNDFHFSLFWKPSSIGKSILGSMEHEQGTGQLGVSLTNVLGA